MSAVDAKVDVGISRQRWLALLLAVQLLGGCSVDSNARDAGGPAQSSPTMDKDADGVRDALDSCQQTQPDLPVDSAGCSMFTGVVEGLVFAPGDHRLTVASRAVLAELVSELNRHPELVFSIDGHTDNRGAAGANLELSKQRVMAVVRYMVTNGIPPQRIKPYGYGESRPLASNATVEGRERNRRIEIRVLGSLP